MVIKQNEENIDIDCKSCGTKCNVFHNEEEDPEYCPFCGTFLLDEDEDFQLDDSDDA